jgi:hypothetical protein
MSLARTLHSTRDLRLYQYALGCALSALVGHARLAGRGWYLLVGGELVVAAEVVL